MNRSRGKRSSREDSWNDLRIYSVGLTVLPGSAEARQLLPAGGGQCLPLAVGRTVSALVVTCSNEVVFLGKIFLGKQFQDDRN